MEQLCRSIVTLLDQVESAQQFGVEAGHERSPWGTPFVHHLDLVPAVGRSWEIVVAFLTGIADPEGIDHLRSAAQAVADHFALGLVDDFGNEEIQWLRALSRGVRVADLAVGSGYSERAMYRELRKLWDRLGVANRPQGLARAARLGLLQPHGGEPDLTGEATPR